MISTLHDVQRVSRSSPVFQFFFILGGKIADYCGYKLSHIHFPPESGRPTKLFSTATVYALRAMVCLAEHPGEPLTGRQIAREAEIPQ